MKNSNIIMLRYKVFAVVICFVAFYAGVILIGPVCIDPVNNCMFIAELMTSIILTTPGDGIVEYKGSVQGIEEPSVTNFILQNISFFIMMIIIPACIVSAIIFYEKLKGPTKSGL